MNTPNYIVIDKIFLGNSTCAVDAKQFCYFFTEILHNPELKRHRVLLLSIDLMWKIIN